MTRLLAIIEAQTVTGPAKNLLEFCRFSRDQIQTTVATYQRAGRPPEAFLDAAAQSGATVKLIHEQSAGDRNVLPQIRALAAEADILQTHAVKSHFLVRWSGLWREKPWVAFHHGYTATDLKMKLYNQLDRWSLRAPRRIVTVSQPFRQQLLAIGVEPERITVLHNAIDPNWFAPQQSPDREGGAGSVDNSLLASRSSLLPPIWIAVGRFSAEKGFPDLIRALALLREQPWTLLLIGDGPDRDALREQASAAGVLDRIQWIGHVKDVRPYYAMADFLVMPSISEGSPNVLLEAMAAQLPVVATRVGGVPEIVTDRETALLVPKATPAELARAMREMMDSPALAEKLQSTARQLIETRFSPQQRVATLMEIYRSLI
jgi:glycosyltransferase involved in cell wall biosynthesis